MTVMNKKRTYRSRLRDEQAAETRARIVEAAAEGFAPWTTELPFNKVAERAGVSVRTVYRYFPTQLDLLDAARAHVVERSGWKPDDVSFETLGSMIARAFEYFGGLLERAGHELQAQAPGMADLRKQRLEAIERVVAPFSNGMDPERIRGVCAVLAGLGRVEFLRGMHEHWGLDGTEAGHAVEWAVGVLLDDLRRNAINEETKQ
jgi:AcrR family transcriptional regulator